jgi:hypothetical protein
MTREHTCCYPPPGLAPACVIRRELMGTPTTKTWRRADPAHRRRNNSIGRLAGAPRQEMKK